MNHTMPIRAAPYRHQREAFAFACRLFGLIRDDNHPESPAAQPTRETPVNTPSPERQELSE